MCITESRVGFSEVRVLCLRLLGDLVRRADVQVTAGDFEAVALDGA